MCVLEGGWGGGGVQFHTNYDLFSGLSWACLKVCAVEIHIFCWFYFCTCLKGQYVELVQDLFFVSLFL